MEYKLREDEIQSWRLLQTSVGSSKLLQPKGFGDTVTLMCWNLPWVVQLLVDEPGGLAAAGPVCPILYELRADGIFRDGAQVRRAWMPASRLVDCFPRLAVTVREVDGVDSFLPSFLLLLL